MTEIETVTPTGTVPVTMRSLLEAGVHFGHRARRWNPKMRPYIFTERNGIHIIDLSQTMAACQSAFDAIRDITASGGIVLFVGTKRQAQETVASEAQRAGMPYVTTRWLGGTLTNFQTIRRRIKYLRSQEARRTRGELELVTKKEALDIEREIEKLNRRLGGIKEMDILPDALFVVDVRREHIAVKEAKLLGIPVIAMVDTNCNPDDISTVIPSNDDAIRAIKLVVAAMAEGAVEGKSMRESAYIEEQAEESERQRIDTSRRVFSPDDDDFSTIEFDEEEDRDADEDSDDDDDDAKSKGKPRR
jgi:small subunit ribosomal protein S2